MREIEVKARVSNIEELVKRIRNAGAVISDPVTQHDQVYGLPGVISGGNNQQPWLRLRAETKDEATTHIFTFKRSITTQLDSIEHETGIDNPTEMQRIIKQLGFVPFTEITKTRRKAHIGKIELCIDEVKDLGSFIEAEKLTNDDADYEKTIAELWNVLHECGVESSDQVIDGYDVLLEQKLNK